MPLIVFEGLDGSGKSSLMRRLQNELEKNFQSAGLKPAVLCTREPGGTALGDRIRQLILEKSDQPPTPRTELLLYEASRAQHVECVILPALKKGDWVLCDRFTASSLAFQAGGRSLSSSWVEKLNDFATDGLRPDWTILLDLSAQESRARRQGRAQETSESEDRIEAEADTFHENVRQAFLNLARKDPQSWLILDARKSLQDSFALVWQGLKDRKWI